jgi:hypothetical protein
MRYAVGDEQYIRGIPTEKKAFKNCISISMTTSTKDISAKLSKDTIQLAGGKSMKHGEEACNLLLEALKDAERERLYALDHPEENEAVVNWYEENIKEKSDGTLIYPRKAPRHLDAILLNRYLRLFYEYNDKTSLMEEMHWLAEKCPQIIDLDCELSTVTTAMVNYNFQLDHPIDRYKVSDAAEDTGLIEDFIVTLNNTAQPTIRFSLPIDPTELGETYKIGKKPQHTFIVYASGKVMHSAPRISLMETAYDKFCKMTIPFQSVPQN